ncbi:hypothetical protein OKW42_003676 [Paraburkholderia sp. WC7.3d]
MARWKAMVRGDARVATDAQARHRESPAFETVDLAILCMRVKGRVSGWRASDGTAQYLACDEIG